MKEDTEVRYAKVYDKRTKLFGIMLVSGEGEWYIEPCFEQLGLDPLMFGTLQSEGWFKKNGRYGYYNLREKRVVVDAKYTFPLYFNNNGYACTWKDYKAGVIDKEGNVLIPFEYDEIHERWQRVDIPDDERRTVTDEDGNEIKVGPKFKQIFRGYSCFTNEGVEKVFNENCQPSAYEDREQERLHYVPEFDNKEVENMTLEEVDNRIREEYVKLIELGYEHPQKWTMSREHHEKINAQEERVQSLITDRRLKMNRSWTHNRENAQRIGRMNDLLMRAVRKGIKLAKRTSKSLEWMEKVSNSTEYSVDVYIYPEWQNSQSDYRYERKYKSSSKEQDRLIDDEDNLSDTHIWNIIANLGKGGKRNGKAVCFDKSFDDYKHDSWDEREMIGDDGQSWTECIHFPAYQDVYFTMPFHHLYLDLFDYSMEDLCNINDFRVNIDVKLQTREQDRK